MTGVSEGPTGLREWVKANPGVAVRLGYNTAFAMAGAAWGNGFLVFIGVFGIHMTWWFYATGRDTAQVALRDMTPRKRYWLDAGYALKSIFRPSRLR